MSADLPRGGVRTCLGDATNSSKDADGIGGASTAAAGGANTGAGGKGGGGAEA